MDDESEAAKRLMRLLSAGFRYSEHVDHTIWMNHPRRDNGRVIFYPTGQVSSVENHDFAQIWLDDPAMFERFMATIKPTRKRDRLAAWGEDIITWTILIVFLAVLWGAIHLVTGFVQDWWQG